MIDYEIRAREAVELLRQQLKNISWDEVDRSETVKKAWKRELQTVRKVIQQSAKSAIPNDRASVWKGVRSVMYRSITGGNVNILESRSKSVTMNMTIYNRMHKRYTSERTRQVESYWGASRSFILRFVNQGTKPRKAGSRGNSRGGSGNRGTLPAKKWFIPAAQSALERMIERMDEVYKTVVNKEFYK